MKKKVHIALLGVCVIIILLFVHFVTVRNTENRLYGFIANRISAERLQIYMPIGWLEHMIGDMIDAQDYNSIENRMRITHQLNDVARNIQTFKASLSAFRGLDDFTRSQFYLTPSSDIIHFGAIHMRLSYDDELPLQFFINIKAIMNELQSIHLRHEMESFRVHPNERNRAVVIAMMQELEDFHNDLVGSFSHLNNMIFELFQ